MKISAVGPLRERVSVQTQSQTIDAAGAITTQWVEAFSCWARVKPVSMTQILLAGRDEGVRLYEAVIRYRTDITTNNRIVWRSRRFDIQGIADETEQHAFLKLMLREIAA